MVSVVLGGANVRIRTVDLLITSELLCHLSYIGLPGTYYIECKNSSHSLKKSKNNRWFEYRNAFAQGTRINFDVWCSSMAVSLNHQ